MESILDNLKILNQELNELKSVSSSVIQKQSSLKINLKSDLNDKSKVISNMHSQQQQEEKKEGGSSNS